MSELLTIEWLKIKKYRTFWVLMGLFVLLMPLWNYEVAKGLINFGGKKGGIGFLDTEYSFPEVWGNVGFWGSIFIMFVSILVIILTTNEYGYKTQRQNVIDGWTKMKFYHAKVLLVVVFALVATLCVFIVGAVFGAANAGSFSGVFSGCQQVVYFFLLSLDYLGFALLIAIWIKRSGLAIGLFLLYSMIIENILKSIINHYSDTPFGNLLFLQSSDELLPFPLMKMARNLIQGASPISMNTYALVTVCWCVLYYITGRILLLKNDW